MWMHLKGSLMTNKLKAPVEVTLTMSLLTSSSCTAVKNITLLNNKTIKLIGKLQLADIIYSLYYNNNPECLFFKNKNLMILLLILLWVLITRVIRHALAGIEKAGQLQFLLQYCHHVLPGSMLLRHSPAVALNLYGSCLFSAALKQAHQHHHQCSSISCRLFFLFEISSTKQREYKWYSDE